MQAQPGLLSGLVQPASKVGGAWHLGPASTPPPVPPADLHYIVSKSTQECWDTRGADTLDLWACVQVRAQRFVPAESLVLRYNLSVVGTRTATTSSSTTVPPPA